MTRLDALSLRHFAHSAIGFSAALSAALSGALSGVLSGALLGALLGPLSGALAAALAAARSAGTAATLSAGLAAALSASLAGCGIPAAAPDTAASPERGGSAGEAGRPAYRTLALSREAQARVAAIARDTRIVVASGSVVDSELPESPVVADL